MEDRVSALTVDTMLLATVVILGVVFILRAIVAARRLHSRRESYADFQAEQWSNYAQLEADGVIPKGSSAWLKGTGPRPEGVGDTAYGTVAVTEEEVRRSRGEIR